MAITRRKTAAKQHTLSGPPALPLPPAHLQDRLLLALAPPPHGHAVVEPLPLQRDADDALQAGRAGWQDSGNRWVSLASGRAMQQAPQLPLPRDLSPSNIGVIQASAP